MLEVKQKDQQTYVLNDGLSQLEVAKQPYNQTIKWKKYTIVQTDNGFDIYLTQNWKHIGSYDFSEVKVSFIQGGVRSYKTPQLPSLNMRVPILQNKIPIQVNQYAVNNPLMLQSKNPAIGSYHMATDNGIESSDGEEDERENFMYYDNVRPIQTVGVYTGLQFEEGPNIDDIELNSYEKLLNDVQKTQKQIYYNVNDLY